MKTNRTVQVGLIQRSDQGAPGPNLDQTCEKIEEAASRGAQIICLQELFQSNYFCQTEDPAHFDLAQTIPGPATDTLAELAARLEVVLIIPLFEKRSPGLYHNTAVVLERDGRLLARYRKMHIPDDPGFYEKFYFTPGDIGFQPVDTSVGRLGVLVCWDQWYPEGARLMALAGAELLLYPTAIGWDRNDSEDEQQRQRQAWIISQRGHAVANGLPVLSCNRTGFEQAPGSEEGIDFWGSSFVAGPQGEMLAEASVDKPQLLVVDVDMARSEAVRRIWPFLRDRRIDAYDDLLKRYRD